MHTTRLLTVSPSMHCIGGGCLLLGRGQLLGGCLLLGGVCLGVGWYPSMHGGRPPPVDRMTDTCKNITFANFVCRQ